MHAQELFSKQEKLSSENEGLRTRVRLDEEKIKFLQSEVTWLHEQIRALKRAQFGKKSESWVSPEQGVLYNEVEFEVSKGTPEEDEAQSETTIPAHKRKRGHRRPIPESLEREVVKIELPENERFTGDGQPLKVIGWEVSEKLKYEPAKVSVIRYERAKYGVDSGDYVKTAPPVPSVIPKGIATPELLAAIITSKYGDGLPLYRIEEIMERQGVDLPRSTMARWVVQVAQALVPVWNVLSDRLITSFYVAVDETQVQVLKENGRKAEDKSWMWVRSTPYGDEKIVLFDYRISRSQEAARQLLDGITGYLQCDGLNAYDVLEKQEGVIRIGCGMHSRRKFESATVDGAKSGRTLGEAGLGYFKKLYDLEEKIGEKPPEERYRLRLEVAEPIWKEMKEWAEGNQPKVPAKSKIGGAFRYFLNEYEYLIGYLKDGRLEIDNGFTERAIRKYAIGRNAWLFSDTSAGAEASSIMYSFTVTAKINGVNPYTAMVRLLTELPLAKSLEDFERLAEIILSPNSQA